MASLRKGDRTKKGQRYQNVTVYKAGLHGCSKRMKDACAEPVAGVCARCKDKIDWKRKYDKYKPLTVPKKCTVCLEKRVHQAYYQVCRECAEGSGVCAKCGRKGEVVESFLPTAVEQAREEAEFHEAVRRLSERERRSLLRMQAQGSVERRGREKGRGEVALLGEEMDSQVRGDRELERETKRILDDT